MRCGGGRSSVNWGAELARSPGVSVPPATAPDCLALVADAEAAARYLATHGRKIQGATMAENEAMRFALPVSPSVGAVAGPLPGGWEMGGVQRTAGAGGLASAPRHVPDPLAGHVIAWVGPFVDIYLSAGLNTGDGGTDAPSCNVNHDGLCVLYRIRWDLGLGRRVGEVARVSDGAGVETGRRGDVQPALSPDERKLTWVRRTYRADAPGMVQERVLMTHYADDGVTEEVRTADWPEMPNWWSNEFLLYSRPDSDRTGRHSSSLWIASTDGETHATAGADSVLGPGGRGARGTSFQDPHTHPAPGYRADRAARIVTFGGRGDDKTPRVSDLFGGGQEEFDLDGFDANPELDTNEPSCQHPAWNLAGTRILCTRHAKMERIDDESHHLLRQLLAFGFTGERWTDPTPVFSVPSASDLDAALGGLLLAGEGRRVVTFKYAEWCADDAFVASTVFSTTVADADDPTYVTSSRVVLVRTADSTIWDLTSEVEESVGAPHGSFHGVFSTCSPAHSSADWSPCAG